MRQEYVTIEFNDGKIMQNIQCSASNVRDNVLYIFEPYNSKGIQSIDETDAYPLANIRCWSTKVYR